VEGRIKKGRDSHVGGDKLCLSHCGYTSWPCCILPESRRAQSWLTRLIAPRTTA
jgi:hypothetical protein